MPSRRYLFRRERRWYHQPIDYFCHSSALILSGLMVDAGV